MRDGSQATAGRDHMGAGVCESGFSSLGVMIIHEGNAVVRYFAIDIRMPYVRGIFFHDVVHLPSAFGRVEGSTASS